MGQPPHTPIYFAVDSRPKRTTDLQRLRNIAANPSVCMLADHYEEDWTHLWWVRVDGTARILEDAARAGRGLDLLAARYPQYQRARPHGAVVAISIDRISEIAGEIAQRSGMRTSSMPIAATGT